MAAAGAAAVVALGFGTGAVLTGGDGERGDSPIPKADLAEAEQAARAAVGSGTVTATEVETDENGYEVEVTRPDGSVVDVQLDASFAVVGQEAGDSDGSERDDAE
jgi:uncharacterized membrane protein YkoI